MDAALEPYIGGWGTREEAVTAVLDALGLEQVGWHWYEGSHISVSGLGIGAVSSPGEPVYRLGAFGSYRSRPEKEDGK